MTAPPRPRLRPAALLATLALAGLVQAACASSSAFRAGERAERREDYDQAVVAYSRATQLAPQNAQYRRSLERARLRAAQGHQAAARLHLAAGRYKEALDELRLTLNLAPGMPGLIDEIKEVEARRREGTTPPSMPEMKQRARERALPGLVLGPEADEPLGIYFRNASLREAYQALGKAAGVNFIFDPQLPDQTITLDLRDVPFDQALTALGAVARTFHRVADAKVVNVVPDTPTKRREYEQQIVKTFFLSNADLKDVVDLLRIVLGARRVAPVPGSNALTINDTPDKVAAAERIIDVVDKQRAEVVVEVEILEVNRSRLQDYGIEITSAVPGVDGIAGAAFPDPRATNTLNSNPYNSSNIVLSNLPGVVYRLLRQDRSTHLLANPQLRTSEGQTAQARFGDQVPIPITTFAPIAQGGIAQQAITSFEYKSVGVNIDITPRVHHDGDVSLALKLDISSVGPAGFQGLPTFNSRTVTSVIRLRDGETNVLAGLISDSDRRSMSGVPGLASVPILGRLFARNRTDVIETDIIMTLTPHIVRRSKITVEDLRSFSVGSETSPLLFEVPGVPPVTPAPRNPDPPKVEPIRPPAPLPTPSP